jgi:hypothetical protein
MNRKNLVSHLENCNPDQLEFLPPEKTSRVRRHIMHKDISWAVNQRSGSRKVPDPDPDPRIPNSRPYIRILFCDCKL